MRSFLLQHLTSLHCPDGALDDILVCASELATNAVLHSHSGNPGEHFDVEIALRAGESIYVAVRDSGGPWARPRAAGTPDEDAECGRGLQVVAALSADTGITGDASGRTAWFLSQWKPV
ncbi:MAG: ATP-binding protein [Streptosporangiales bacterium]|nr:ATP-binding protein [Streptosporangiales bacterium]